MNVLLALYLSITAIILLILAGIGWRRRSASASREFALLAGGIAFYVAGNALELTQSSLEMLKFALRLEWCFIPYIPTCWLIFTLVWCGYGHVAKRIVRLPLFLFSTLMMLLAQTNDWHSLVYTALWVDTSGSFPHLMLQIGPLCWVMIGYLMMCNLIINTMLIRQFLTAGPFFRRQALVMVLASIIPWSMIVAYLADIGPHGVPLDPYAFTTTALLFAWTVLRKQLLDLVPVARHGLVEMMRDPVLVFDDTGRLVDHNRAACRLLPDGGSGKGLTLAEISLAMPDLAEAIGRAKLQDEALFQQGDQVFSLSLTTLQPATGQNLTLCLCHDISGQARAVALAEERTRQLAAQAAALEAALEERHRAYEQQKKFLGMISHEYRTPLAIISGNLHLMERHLSEDRRTASPLARITRSISRLQHLFDTSLKHAYIDEEAPQLVTAPVAPHALLLELAADASRDWPDRRFELDLNMPADAIIKADRSLLRIALWNLVANAVNYSPVTEPITISGREESSGTYLEIRDHGPGIPLAERGRICNKFYRGSSSTGTSGSGMGLWLVSWIAEEHGGGIVLDDNDPTGTVAGLRFPGGERQGKEPHATHQGIHPPGGR